MSTLASHYRRSESGGRPIVSEGRWQSMQRTLQARLKSDDSITLLEYLILRVRRYAVDYNRGG